MAREIGVGWLSEASINGSHPQGIVSLQRPDLMAKAQDIVNDALLQRELHFRTFTATGSLLSRLKPFQIVLKSGRNDLKP